MLAWSHQSLGLPPHSTWRQVRGHSVTGAAVPRAVCRCRPRLALTTGSVPRPHLAPSVLVTPYYALQLRICIHIVSILSSLTDGEHRTDI